MNAFKHNNNNHKNIKKRFVPIPNLNLKLRKKLIKK